MSLPQMLQMIKSILESIPKFMIREMAKTNAQSSQ